LPVKYSIVKDQTSSVLLSEDAENQLSTVYEYAGTLTFGFFVYFAFSPPLPYGYGSEKHGGPG